MRSNLYKVFRLLIAILSIFNFYPICYGQRGNNFSFPQENAPQTPLDGFPGFFDTNMAQNDSFVFDLPSFTLDFGLSDRLTLGINSLGAFFTSVSLQPLLLAKARYRLFSTPQFRNALTFYGGYSNISKTKNNPSSHANALLFSNNFNYYLNENSQLYGSLLFGHIDYSVAEASSPDFEKTSFRPFFISLGYQYFFSDWVGVSPLVIYNAYSHIEFDSSQIAFQSESKLAAESSNAIFRLALDTKIGDNFLLTIYGIISFAGSNSFATPFVSCMYRWQP